MPKKSDFSSPDNSPKRTTPKQFSPRPKVEWKGYINVPLLEADKRHFHTWKQEQAIVNEQLEAALRDGYKLSIDWQQRENAFRASFYCQNAEFAEAGYSLSVFASDWWKAVLQLLYIHAVKCQSSWEKFIGAKPRVDDWDDFE